MPADPAFTLAEHVCQTAFAALPASAVHATKRDMLDTLGAALGGSVAPGVAELSSYHHTLGRARREQCVVARRTRTGAAGGAGECHHGTRARF